MNAVSELDTAIGQELLRARLLKRARPHVADRYEIESVLGRGATGLVVAARDLDLGRDVALKLTPAEGSRAELKEAQSQASLEHPNVALLYDARIVDAVLSGRSFRLRLLSMQRVDGPNLRVWLREAPRSPEQIVAVFTGAGAGLAAAHARKIVHRDFKPENVLVSSAGVAKVVDFGFALTANSTRSAEEGRPSGVAGTDAYMAPEARDGRASVRSDQFSFGMSLAEALTGSLARPSRRTPAGVDPDVWAAVVRATSDVAGERFESMTAVLDALRAVSPRLSSPSTTPRAASSPARPSASRSRLGAVLTVGVAAAAFGLVWLVGPARLAETFALSMPSAPARLSGAGHSEDAGVAIIDAFVAVAAETTDAGPPEAVCPAVPRELDFHTTSRPGTVRYGCYHMTIAPDPSVACGFTASVEKLGSGAAYDPCPRPSGRVIRADDIHFTVSPDGCTTIEVALETASPPRDYSLSVQFVGDVVHGGYRAWNHGERGAPIDDGDVDGNAVSHSGALPGRDDGSPP